jgi:3-oxoacyl-[acyl-carrier protein] reductase
VCAKAAEAMIKTQGSQPILGKEVGVLVNTSSSLSQDGPSGMVAYAASKGGVNGMALAMARDLGRYGIRVVTILPSMIRTPMTSGMSPEMQAKALDDFPVGRIGEPDDYAHTVKYLIENSWQTGSLLRLDGGSRSSKL